MIPAPATSLIPADNAFALLAVFFAIAVIGASLEKTKIGRRVSGVMFVIALAIVLSHFDIIPASAPTYDAIWTYLMTFGAPGVALILLAVHSASLVLFFIGTLVAGCGFGASFLGTLRTVVPLALPHERAGLMSAYYALSYLAFCLPSLLAGNLTRTFGLVKTTEGYGVVLIVLAVGALLALLRQRPAQLCSAAGRP